MINEQHIRSLLIGLCFVFLIIIFIFKKQDKKLNWSIFYAALWISFSLAIINYICVEQNLWTYNSKTPLALKMPFDLYFIWIVFWAIIPVYFFKGKYPLILMLLLFWLDIILMPELENLGIIKLNQNWYFGEIALIFLVWLPSYMWARIYFNQTHLKWRSFFQVSIMCVFLILIIPYIIKYYTAQNFDIENFNIYNIQIIFILALPSLIAVIDLATKGNGTPFPYDKTSKLVKNGVYAYCKNPIQWSFTVIFIPLAIIYQSWLLAAGFLVSIAYTIGVSNTQEKEDMLNRFGQNWIDYKSLVPSWRFLWKPKNYPKGTIYFKKDCNQCEGLKKWFTKQNTANLNIEFSYKYKASSLEQVTYIDYNGNKYKSVTAIAHAFEHINLVYASLGWFMRFPIIKNILQIIIDAMGFDQSEEYCGNYKKNKA